MANLFREYTIVILKHFLRPYCCLHRKQRRPNSFPLSYHRNRHRLKTPFIVAMSDVTMPDYNYGGTDEENAEIRTLSLQLVRGSESSLTSI